jgi:hypothetical protein
MEGIKYTPSQHHASQRRQSPSRPEARCLSLEQILEALRKMLKDQER